MLKFTIKKYFILTIACICYCYGCHITTNTGKSATKSPEKERKKSNRLTAAPQHAAKTESDKQKDKDLTHETTAPQHPAATESDKPNKESCSTTSDNPANKNPNLPRTQLGHQETRPPLPKWVIVTLHGLSMDNSEEDEIISAVKNKFGNVVEIIQPKCREGRRSIDQSIDKQVKNVVEEIKITLCNRYPQYSEEELKALPINIFGYSQGGLVACIIAVNYQNELYINSLVLCHAPLSGTDVLECRQSDIDAFDKKAKPGLVAIGYNYKTAGLEKLERKLVPSILNGWLQKLGIFFKGVTDMRINSKICSDIITFLRKENKAIPTLIIAGYIDNLTEYFDFPEGE